MHRLYVVLVQIQSAWSRYEASLVPRESSTLSDECNYLDVFSCCQLICEYHSYIKQNVIQEIQIWHYFHFCHFALFWLIMQNDRATEENQILTPCYHPSSTNWHMCSSTGLSAVTSQAWGCGFESFGGHIVHHDLFCISLQLKKALLGPKRFANQSYLPRVFCSKTD